MKHTKTIEWKTPDTFPEDVVCLHFVPNDGSNEMFGLEEVEAKAEFFIEENGCVFAMVKGSKDYSDDRWNGQRVHAKYAWSNQNNTWDTFQFDSLSGS